MKLFKWNISDIKPKFPKFLENFWGKKITDQISSHENVSTVPSVNISDEDKAFEISAVIPGFDKKDVKIEISNGCLIISSEKQYEDHENNRNWMRREFGYASFQRIFKIPDNADENLVQAEMKNGILTVKLGKKISGQKHPKIINIQ